jgi:hypothetical protein
LDDQLGAPALGQPALRLVGGADSARVVENEVLKAENLVGELVGFRCDQGVRTLARVRVISISFS